MVVSPNLTQRYDVLWLGQETDRRPWGFIYFEDEDLVKANGYGENRQQFEVPKSDIKWVLEEPIVFNP